MNLKNIEVEHIKMFMPQDYLIIVLIIILLIGITFVMISKINKLSISSNNKTAKVLSQIILVLLLSNIAVLAIPQEIKNRAKDHYRVVIKNEEIIEEKTIPINKDQYIFLKKMKKKDFLSQKFTKEEINRAKAILIR